MTRVVASAVLALGVLSGCKTERIVGFVRPGAPCQTDADCGAAMACSAGVCRRRCPNCGSAEVCVDGLCYEGCQTSGPAAVDFQSDVANCGGCGVVCPVPVHAGPARCQQGVCARGPCESGFFDLDGPATLGCEAFCANHRCTFPDGGTTVIDNEPLPETGLVFQAVASGGSYGSATQSNAQHSNVGLAGESTPGGAVEQTSNTHIHVGGFNASLHQRP